MKILSAAFLFFFLLISVKAQIPPVGTIDFYGLRSISEAKVREKLQIKEGDPMFSKAEINEVEKRLALLPNVVEARIAYTCCTNDGKMILYAGIREKGSPALIFHTAPNGTIRLTNEILKVGKDYSEANQKAVLKGDDAEDRSAGHSLMNNVEARAIQEKFIPIANQNLTLLRRVLRESADAEHRALAAEVIAYHKNKGVIVADLVNAMKDTDGGVRNNAMRALGLIAGYALANPEKKIKVPFTPFVDMLNSLEWTDRNKSSLALGELTAKRDAALLKLLRQKALPSLIEMARWKNDGHAGMPFIILGRVAGFSDDEIWRALTTGKREDLIQKMQKDLQIK